MVIANLYSVAIVMNRFLGIENKTISLLANKHGTRAELKLMPESTSHASRRADFSHPTFKAIIDSSLAD